MQRPPGASSPPAPSRPRVLVVGTTADYIDWIRRECPGEALFLTDPEVRRRAVESCPAPADELLCDLTDFQDVCASLDRHLSRYGLKPAGIACFDCESMELAARLAGRFALPYTSVSAVGNCRDKLRTKSVWQANGLDTPPGAAVGTAEEAVRFFRQSGGAIVLKPPTGSGSELVYQCADENACERAHRKIWEGLQKRRTQRLYADPTAGESGGGRVAG